MLYAAVIGLRASGAGVGVRIFAPSAGKAFGSPLTRKNGFDDYFRLKIAGLAPQGDESLFRIFFANKMICFALYQGVEFQGDSRGNAIVGVGLATDSTTLNVAGIFSYLADRLAALRHLESPAGRMVLPIDDLDASDFLPDPDVSWLAAGEQAWRSRSVAHPNIVFLKPDVAQFEPEALAKAATSFLLGRKFLADHDIYFSTSERLLGNAANENLEILPFNEVLHPQSAMLTESPAAKQGVSQDSSTSPHFPEHRPSMASSFRDEVGQRESAVAERLHNLEYEIREISVKLADLRPKSYTIEKNKGSLDQLKENWPIYAIYMLLIFVLIYLAQTVSRTANIISTLENGVREVGFANTKRDSAALSKDEINICFDKAAEKDLSDAQSSKSALAQLKKCITENNN